MTALHDPAPDILAVLEGEIHAARAELAHRVDRLGALLELRSAAYAMAQRLGHSAFTLGRLLEVDDELELARLSALLNRIAP